MKLYIILINVFINIDEFFSMKFNFACVQYEVNDYRNTIVFFLFHTLVEAKLIRIHMKRFTVRPKENIFSKDLRKCFKF